MFDGREGVNTWGYMWGTSKRKISCKCISTYKFVGHESSNVTFSLFRTILLSFEILNASGED